MGSMSGSEELDRPLLQCALWFPECCPDRRCCRKASKDSRGRSSLSPLCPSSSLSALLLGLAAMLPPLPSPRREAELALLLRLRPRGLVAPSVGAALAALACRCKAARHVSSRGGTVLAALCWHARLHWWV